MPTTQPGVKNIKVANPSLEDRPQAYLTADVNAGAVAVTITSTVGFPITTDADFYVLVGSYGDEKAEIKLVDASATTGTTFTIAALTNSHETSDPITYIEYNKISFYGLTTATSVTYNLIVARDIDTTQQFTEYTYTTGTYPYFATAYYNSTADTISEYSEIIGTSSFTRNSVERIISSAAKKALTKIDENANSQLNWDSALEMLQDGLDEIISRKKRWGFLNTLSTGTTTTAATEYINKPSDLSQLLFLKINGSTLRPVSALEYMSYKEVISSTGQPCIFTEKNNKYYLYPTPDASYNVIYEYYKTPTVIENMSTEIDYPFVIPLVYYCGSQFAYIRGNTKKGDELYNKFGVLLERQVEDFSGPSQDGFAEVVEQTSGINYDEFGQ